MNWQIDAQDLVSAVRAHPLYAHVRDAHALRTFMRSHVFAVWDFQSLLKALQRAVTCVEVPWLPTADAEARHLINSIVLDEESDESPWGGHLSHYELYYRSMQECGADTGPIDRFIASLRRGVSIDDALSRCGISLPVQNFVRTTLRLATSRDVHRIAAGFSFGREDIIPEMFDKLVTHLASVEPSLWHGFHFYLTRHISTDADRHGPLARSLVARLCGDDPVLRREAEETARQCLQARLSLWDGIQRELAFAV